MKKYTVALVGATGLVGGTILKVLAEKQFPVAELILLASQKSAGKTIDFLGKTYSVKPLTANAFDGVDFAFFAAGGAVSRQFVAAAVRAGALVIDNSSEFRMDDAVPLVVPEVNGADLLREQGIIANPNCSTIQCMAALKCIQNIAGIKRVVYSTYQAVSGSGMKGLRDLDEGLNDFYPHPIEGNILPHIDVFYDDGYTKEEKKMINETQKILHQAIAVTATAVRVPVRFAHCVSINVETVKPFQLDEIKRALATYPELVLVDDPSQLKYPLPRAAEGKNEVFVGRVRRDNSVANGLNLWTVADNIRKGAATNAVQIGLACIERGIR